MSNTFDPAMLTKLAPQATPEDRELARARTLGTRVYSTSAGDRAARKTARESSQSPPASLDVGSVGRLEEETYKGLLGLGDHESDDSSSKGGSSSSSRRSSMPPGNSNVTHVIVDEAVDEDEERGETYQQQQHEGIEAPVYNPEPHCALCGVNFIDRRGLARHKKTAGHLKRENPGDPPAGAPRPGAEAGAEARAEAGAQVAMPLASVTMLPPVSGFLSGVLPAASTGSVDTLVPPPVLSTALQKIMATPSPLHITPVVPITFGRQTPASLSFLSPTSSRLLPAPPAPVLATLDVSKPWLAMAAPATAPAVPLPEHASIAGMGGPPPIIRQIADTDVRERERGPIQMQTSRSSSSSGNGNGDGNVLGIRANTNLLAAATASPLLPATLASSSSAISDATTASSASASASAGTVLISAVPEPVEGVAHAPVVIPTDPATLGFQAHSNGLHNLSINLTKMGLLNVNLVTQNSNGRGPSVRNPRFVYIDNPIVGWTKIVTLQIMTVKSSQAGATSISYQSPDECILKTPTEFSQYVIDREIPNESDFAGLFHWGKPVCVCHDASNHNHMRSTHNRDRLKPNNSKSGRAKMVKCAVGLGGCNGLLHLSCVLSNKEIEARGRVRYLDECSKYLGFEQERRGQLKFRLNDIVETLQDIICPLCSAYLAGMPQEEQDKYKNARHLNECGVLSKQVHSHISTTHTATRASADLSQFIDSNAPPVLYGVQGEDYNTTYKWIVPTELQQEVFESTQRFPIGLAKSRKALGGTRTVRDDLGPVWEPPAPLTAGEKAALAEEKALLKAREQEVREENALYFYANPPLHARIGMECQVTVINAALPGGSKIVTFRCPPWLVYNQQILIKYIIGNVWAEPVPQSKSDPARLSATYPPALFGQDPTGYSPMNPIASDLPNAQLRPQTLGLSSQLPTLHFPVGFKSASAFGLLSRPPNVPTGPPSAAIETSRTMSVENFPPQEDGPRMKVTTGGRKNAKRPPPPGLGGLDLEPLHVSGPFPIKIDHTLEFAPTLKLFGERLDADVDVGGNRDDEGEGEGDDSNEAISFAAAFDDEPKEEDRDGPYGGIQHTLLGNVDLEALLSAPAPSVVESHTVSARAARDRLNRSNTPHNRNTGDLSSVSGSDNDSSEGDEEMVKKLSELSRQDHRKAKWGSGVFAQSDRRREKDKDKASPASKAKTAPSSKSGEAQRMSREVLYYNPAKSLKATDALYVPRLESDDYTPHQRKDVINAVTGSRYAVFDQSFDRAQSWHRKTFQIAGASVPKPNAAQPLSVFFDGGWVNDRKLLTKRMHFRRSEKNNTSRDRSKDGSKDSLPQGGYSSSAALINDSNLTSFVAGLQMQLITLALKSIPVRPDYYQNKRRSENLLPASDIKAFQEPPLLQWMPLMDGGVRLACVLHSNTPLTYHEVCKVITDAADNVCKFPEAGKEAKSSKSDSKLGQASLCGLCLTNFDGKSTKIFEKKDKKSHIREEVSSMQFGDVNYALHHECCRVLECAKECKEIPFPNFNDPLSEASQPTCQETAISTESAATTITVDSATSSLTESSAGSTKPRPPLLRWGPAIELHSRISTSDSRVDAFAESIDFLNCHLCGKSGGVLHHFELSPLRVSTKPPQNVFVDSDGCMREPKALAAPGWVGHPSCISFLGSSGLLTAKPPAALPAHVSGTLEESDDDDDNLILQEEKRLEEKEKLKEEGEGEAQAQAEGEERERGEEVMEVMLEHLTDKQKKQEEEEREQEQQQDASAFEFELMSETFGSGVHSDAMEVAEPEPKAPQLTDEQIAINLVIYAEKLHGEVAEEMAEESQERPIAIPGKEKEEEEAFLGNAENKTSGSGSDLGSESETGYAYPDNELLETAETDSSNDSDMEVATPSPEENSAAAAVAVAALSVSEIAAPASTASPSPPLAPLPLQECTTLAPAPAPTPAGAKMEEQKTCDNTKDVVCEVAIPAVVEPLVDPLVSVKRKEANVLQPSAQEDAARELAEELTALEKDLVQNEQEQEQEQEQQQQLDRDMDIEEEDRVDEEGKEDGDEEEEEDVPTKDSASSAEAAPWAPPEQYQIDHIMFLVHSNYPAKRIDTLFAAVWDYLKTQCKWKFVYVKGTQRATQQSAGVSLLDRSSVYIPAWNAVHIDKQKFDTFDERFKRNVDFFYPDDKSGLLQYLRDYGPAPIPADGTKQEVNKEVLVRMEGLKVEGGDLLNAWKAYSRTDPNKLVGVYKTKAYADAVIDKYEHEKNSSERSIRRHFDSAEEGESERRPTALSSFDSIFGRYRCCLCGQQNGIVTRCAALVCTVRAHPTCASVMGGGWSLLRVATVCSSQAAVGVDGKLVTPETAAVPSEALALLCCVHSNAMQDTL